MQPTNLQKDKLELIDKIIHIEDQSTLAILKDVLSDDNSDFRNCNQMKHINI